MASPTQISTEVRSPMADWTIPMAACPRGRHTMEPSMSYDTTRASRSAGTCRCRLRGERAEDVDQAADRDVDEAELQHDRPEPGAGAEVGPALGQFVEDA